MSPLRPVLRVKFRRAKHLWVNLGCGASGKPGWTNVDIVKWPGINCVFDIRKGLPFANESVNGIFCEHAFEHLEYCNAVPELTSECSRVLVPGGVLHIIIVPDAGRYLRAYCENNWNSFATLRTLDADRRDILGFQYSAKMELINVVFRQNEEHKWAYDFENLELVLKRFGFSEIHQQEFGKSIEPKLGYYVTALNNGRRFTQTSICRFLNPP